MEHTVLHKMVVLIEQTGAYTTTALMEHRYTQNDW